ncbi:protein of unknown function (plasmid) [Azospirillum baldaniorum]|uniref:Uncharacterized protein n=1 Tax=Azospirillum baldaniorum TaxID=1064539 RepID=A0A9P1JXS4_9PROT|nr:protein of unknown function [Azospirillum baldaniorum]
MGQKAPWTPQPAALEWGRWFNPRHLLKPVDSVPLVEAESALPRSSRRRWLGGLTQAK